MTDKMSNKYSVIVIIEQTLKGHCYATAKLPLPHQPQVPTRPLELRVCLVGRLPPPLGPCPPRRREQVL